MGDTRDLAAVDDAGKVTIWSSHQSINRVQATIAESLDLPMARIRVVAPPAQDVHN